MIADSWKQDASKVVTRLGAAGAILLVEMLLLIWVYQLVVDLDCRNTELLMICRIARTAVVRGLLVLMAFAVIAWALWPVFSRFAQYASSGIPAGWKAWVLHGTGAVLLFAPALALQLEGGDLGLALVCWTLGALCVVVSLMRWVAPWSAWRRLATELGGRIFLLLAGVFVLPDIALLAEGLWQHGELTLLTFVMVVLTLRAVDPSAFADVDRFVVGIDSFAVEIAPQCSGMEGFVLITGFLVLYAALFHDTLRQGRFWGILFPLALLASWVFNVLRIAILVLIGAHISPELAVDGFHSYAGWLFFTLLALSIMTAGHVIPALHREAGTRAVSRSGQTAATPSLKREEATFLIAPFIVFMLASLVVNAFFVEPAAGYPLVAAAMCLALLPFAQRLRGLSHEAGRALVAPVLVGLAVGALWIWPVLAGQAPEPDASLLPGWAPWAVALWIAARLVGTILFVPIIEELFFREYLIGRLFGTRIPVRAIAGVAVSTLAFAALHGRWWEAGLAGLAFAFIYLRKHRAADAILAHMVANAFVAAAAWATGDWSLI